jgi:hypothetical protein
VDHEAVIRPVIIETSGNKVEPQATGPRIAGHPAAFVHTGNPEIRADTLQSACSGKADCVAGLKPREAACASGATSEHGAKTAPDTLARGIRRNDFTVVAGVISTKPESRGPLDTIRLREGGVDYLQGSFVPARGRAHNFDFAGDIA